LLSVNGRRKNILPDPKLSVDVQKAWRHCFRSFAATVSGTVA